MRTPVPDSFPKYALQGLWHIPCTPVCLSGLPGICVTPFELVTGHMPVTHLASHILSLFENLLEGNCGGFLFLFLFFKERLLNDRKQFIMDYITCM